jgi:S1-C subfamily serine protease
MRLSSTLTPVILLLARLAHAADPSIGPDGATLAQAAKSVVQVIASGCAGEEPDRAGSGFIIGTDGLIVTDLHVVIGCNTLQAKYQGVDQLPATIARVLKARDLALLKVDHPPAATGLQLSADTPQIKEELDVIGFPLGLPAYDNSSLHVSLATETTPELRAALRDQELNQLKSVGFPSLDTQVIRVDGNLLPGHSGAPLINYQGRVAGVGSGGLERGTVGIGWAIRAQYVTELLKSNEGAPAASSGIASVSFATTIPGTGKNEDAVKCGDLSLVKRRVLPLGALIKSADDPAKLHRLVTDLTSGTIKPLESEPYAIWTEPRSGAGIALPAGLRVESGPQNCVVHTDATTIDYLISLKPLPFDTNSATWELAANREAWMVGHQALVLSGARELINDAAHSVKPRVENGGIIRRSMATGQVPGRSPVRVFTSTLTGRGAFISIFVVNQAAASGDTAQTAVDLGSQMAERERLAWTRGLLAVNFAAFPPQSVESQQQGSQGEGQQEDVVLPGARAYPRVRCGDLAFIPLTPSRTLAELAPPDVIPADFSALLRSETGLGADQISRSQYDVWVQPTRGATILLPQGAQLMSDSGACHMSAGIPSISYTVRVIRNDPKSDQPEAGSGWVQAETEAFVNDLAKRAGISAQSKDATQRFGADVTPNGVVSGFLLKSSRAGGASALLYVFRARRDQVLALFAIVDLNADANGPIADRLALAQGLAAIRFSTLTP